MGFQLPWAPGSPAPVAPTGCPVGNARCPRRTRCCPHPPRTESRADSDHRHPAPAEPGDAARSRRTQGPRGAFPLTRGLRGGCWQQRVAGRREGYGSRGRRRPGLAHHRPRPGVRGRRVGCTGSREARTVGGGRGPRSGRRALSSLSLPGPGGRAAVALTYRLAAEDWGGGAAPRSLSPPPRVSAGSTAWSCSCSRDCGGDRADSRRGWARRTLRRGRRARRRTKPPFFTPAPAPPFPGAAPAPCPGTRGAREGHETRCLLCVGSRRQLREQGRAK